MSIFATMYQDAVPVLREGGVAVLRTDTLYGLLARADDRQAVERVYTIKQRTPSKSPIVLIASLDQMFDQYDEHTVQRLNELWPDKVSIILPSSKAPEWITRGNASVVYRLPADEGLREMLAQTGPLIAPSANPESLPPAMTAQEAQIYFGDHVDIYIDGGEVSDDTPSQLYRLTSEGMERLR